MFGGQYGIRSTQFWGVFKVDEIDAKRPSTAELQRWVTAVYGAEYEPVPVQMSMTYDVMFREAQKVFLHSGHLVMKTSPMFRTVVLNSSTEEPLFSGYFVLVELRASKKAEGLRKCFRFVDSPERRILPEVLYS